jgi:hypothetical protein
MWITKKGRGTWFCKMSMRPGPVRWVIRNLEFRVQMPGSKSQLYTYRLCKSLIPLCLSVFILKTWVLISPRVQCVKRLGQCLMYQTFSYVCRLDLNSLKSIPNSLGELWPLSTSRGVICRMRLLASLLLSRTKTFFHNSFFFYLTWTFGFNKTWLVLGIFLYSYLYLKLAKMLCLSYYRLCLLFNKIGEGGRTGSA